MSIITVKPSQARQAILTAIKARLVGMMHGSPAIGKSSIVHAIAEEFNLKVIDLRLSQCDPTDLLGFPRIVDGKAGYAPMETFPVEGDSLPFHIDADGKPTEVLYAGWLLFLDELPTAPPAVQAAAYKLILDRMVGQNRLHKKVAIVGAGNLESDNALVQPMSTALQSRMLHISLQLDHNEWLEWARTNKLNFRITSYINYKPEALYTFDPNHTDHTYASPRTWEFADRVMKVNSDLSDPLMLPLLGGCISEGVAAEFIQFCKIENELPSLKEIVAMPDSCRMPKEPSTLFLMSGMLGNGTTKDNLDEVMQFVKRMPAEFQTISLREIIKRNNALLGHPVMQKWIANAGRTLF